MKERKQKKPGCTGSEKGERGENMLLGGPQQGTASEKSRQPQRSAPVKDCEK